MRRILLFSTSTLHGGSYLEYAAPWLEAFLPPEAEVLFVPFARPGGISHDRYTALFREAMARQGFRVSGLHEADDPRQAVAAADHLFVGGGNTFVLLRGLYEAGLMEAIRERVAAGMRYMGSSAGSNVAGRTIGTTNDMPIVQPPRLDALGLVPFNINPHYLDPDPAFRHMGETRETRIREFLVFNPWPVIGLREGALLRVEAGDEGGTVRLAGDSGARLFRPDQEPQELEAGARLDFLLAPS